MNKGLKISLSILFSIISISALVFIILVNVNAIKLDFSVLEIDKLNNFSGESVLYVLKCSLYITTYSLISLAFFIPFIWGKEKLSLMLILAVILVSIITIVMMVFDFVGRELKFLDIISGILGYALYWFVLNIFITGPVFCMDFFEFDSNVMFVLLPLIIYCLAFIISFIVLFLFFLLCLIMPKILLLIVIIVVIVVTVWIITHVRVVYY